MSEENKNAEGQNQKPGRSARLPRQNLQARGGFPPPPPGYGFPPPPPGFRGFPPPPPPGFRGFPPPPPHGYVPQEEEYEEYEEIEYIEEEVTEGEESSEEFEEIEEVEEEEEPAFTRPRFNNAPKGRDLVADGNETFQNMQREGEAKAVEVERAEGASRRRSIVFKIFAGLIITSALIGALVFVISVLSGGLVEHQKDPNLIDESAWTLSDDSVNYIVKKFYRTIGGIPQMSQIRNRHMDGVISYADGPKEDFYCIENNARVYIRIGGASADRVYFINPDGTGKKLKTTSHIGPFDPINPREGEALLNAVLYDELLSNAAFNQSASIRSPFRDAGRRRIGDVVYECIAVSTGETNDIFCFDMVSNLLTYKIIERNGMNIRVEYSDFKEYPEGYTYPATRKVFINEILAATSNITRISTNRDIMFPR